MNKIILHFYSILFYSPLKYELSLNLIIFSVRRSAMFSRLTQGVTSVLQELSGEEHRDEDADLQVSLDTCTLLRYMQTHTHTHFISFSCRMGWCRSCYQTLMPPQMSLPLQKRSWTVWLRQSSWWFSLKSSSGRRTVSWSAPRNGSR